MSLYKELIEKKEAISVIGLGYVGMPLAIEFSKYFNVIGFDINEKKISDYKSNIDPTDEVGSDVLSKCDVKFTSSEDDLKFAKFHIVAVPTPINNDKTPNLVPVEEASRMVGRILKKGSIVVYESTVYPGVTENVCLPILEETSGLKCGIDFTIGYSPERINPGDKKNRLTNIVKIVSGINSESLEMISQVYKKIIQAGVFKASSIKVAEAAKVVENSQRDINIAFMNELAIAFDKMQIDTQEVISAMNTKWNALGFYPGLVGGHCIGIDPYYFIYEAEKLGYHSRIIQTGRRINDEMSTFIAESIIKQLIKTGKRVIDSKVVIFGFTFKENTPDIRNTKVLDIYNTLKEYGIKAEIVDPIADKNEVYNYYNIKLLELTSVKNADCLVFAVPHRNFKDINLNELESMYKKVENKEKVLIDLRGHFKLEDVQKKGYTYWRL